MKYTILGFSQKKAVELGLNTKDLLILRWFVDFLGSGRMARKLINGIEYYWVDYSGVIKELPILYTEKHDTIYRVLKKLDKIGILEHATLKQGGTWSYYKLGYRYIELISDSYQQVGNKSDCSDINPYPSDINPTQTDINPERKTHLLYPSTIPCNYTTQSSAVVDKNKEIIEEKTHLKLSNNMQKKVSAWDENRLLKAVDIFIEKKGEAFSFLEKIYRDNRNFMEKDSEQVNKTKFHNFNETFTQYTSDELDEIIKKSQKEKFS
ncbi:DNA replication protein DnaD/DnaB [Clostridioides difficile]|nr:hypothetical protein [Clostridioides difficile]UWD43130.1 hypothetical protein NYF05_09160 [Clostridioides difficile]UWD43324.1 hypothetical protein NYU56_08905 [Clostridioides difficile]VFF94211.1 DNA replication protein DnaD/DnaB [Clostridioides difficile]VIG01677.1 DNA replication protein DnaD/DnaB [Clostridioides difficile]